MSRHMPCGSSAPGSTGQHVPKRPVWLQLTHAPRQPMLQQTPSAQNPEAQSPSLPHSAPGGLGPQLPFTQRTPGTQSALDRQVTHAGARGRIAVERRADRRRPRLAETGPVAHVDADHGRVRTRARLAHRSRDVLAAAAGAVAGAVQSAAGRGRYRADARRPRRAASRNGRADFRGTPERCRPYTSRCRPCCSRHRRRRSRSGNRGRSRRPRRSSRPRCRRRCSRPPRRTTHRWWRGPCSTSRMPRYRAAGRRRRRPAPNASRTS